MKVEVSFGCLHGRARSFVNNTVHESKMHGRNRCHTSTPVSELKTSDPTSWRRWNYKPLASPPSLFLDGPACLKKTKRLFMDVMGESVWSIVPA